METLRPTSILPAIKCSTCGVEIEISSMGEHVCGPVTTTTKKPAILGSTSLDTSKVPSEGTTSSLGGYGSGLGTSSADRNLFKPARTAPPRIDSAAANKPYIQRDMLSPGHNPASAIRSASATAPHSASKPLKSPMLRSMTTPVPRIHRPPSPLLSSNLDCAFPPFPGSRPVSRAKNTNTHSPVVGSDRLGAELHAEPDPYIGPKSPRTSGGAAVMERLNTIAPGPFDARRRASNDELRSSSRSPTPRSAGEPLPTLVEAESTRTMHQPTSPGSDPSQPESPPVSFVSVPPPTNREGRPVPQRPVRPEPLDGFLAMLKNEADASTMIAAGTGQALRPEARSNTLPNPTAVPLNSSLPRRPSEPGMRARRPTLTGPSASTPTFLPNASGMGFSDSGVPPMPPLSTLQAHSQQQTIHAPSNSASSTSSTRSYAASSSRSDLSPPISAASSVSMLSSAMEEISREEDPSMVIPNLQIRTKSSQSRLRADEPKAATTPASPALPSLNFASTTQHPEPPESPVVPSSQSFARRLPHQFPVPPSGLPPSLGLTTTKTRNNTLTRPPTSKAPGKRPGTATKHHCRGCEEPITGKSVKAADGRLTGRYHRQCFVCKTCQSPFATADFYVINNDPYCEQHYHKLNNSLCAKCDCGIEGPYLETQQQQKFHTKCFTCQDCRRVLSDDYFEIGGSVYCEQHAFRKLHRQEGRVGSGLAPSTRMERRTTRLMMM
ncbi:hypothetical protein BDV97DRAFT_397703 [Delphinella strobiligena]|nr:hypothetical protein BDV97DRAFT_397703 [Delphinella strobiligena]